jgi:hypothetical protein
MIRVMAPFTPFLTEFMYRNLRHLVANQKAGTTESVQQKTFQLNFKMFFAAIMALFVENSIQSIDFIPIHLFKNSSSFQLQFDHVANSECFCHFSFIKYHFSVLSPLRIVHWTLANFDSHFKRGGLRNFYFLIIFGEM